MNHRKIFFWSITVALAGFLFGFDTVVISGADLSLQELWPRGEVFHGFVIMASALWGTVIGALFGGIPTDKLGRKKTLFWIGIFYFVSAVGSALANDPWVFACLRFIGGLAVGASTIAAPAYISEIAPANNRGKLVALYQFNIVFGILVAFLSNYLMSGIPENAWRWMIGAEAVPAFLYTLMVLTVPESPRWLLVKKQDRKAAAATLRLINPHVDPEIEMLRINADHDEADKTETIFSPKYRRPLMLAFLVAFFNQFSGINAFLYYAPRIFEIAGLEKSSALLSSVGIGIANLVFTLLGLSLIDRLGRRQLMYIGSFGYIISLSLVALAFALEWKGMAVPGFLFLFIAAHAIGQGAVIWVFIAEIFPNHLRASGQAFGSSVHWWLAAIIPSMMPVMISSIGITTVFVGFAFMMVLQLLWVWRMMPETKGVSLEDLEKRLVKDGGR
ncbi:MAG: sugar porter family MFS transporter [Saprospiraceae bacterium]|nr:sugar porter family MFS transporter [Saprospiraceae bacterium]